MNTMIEKYRKLLVSTKRKGIADLFNHMVQNGFFESPASHRFHGVYPGGLAEHCKSVYDMVAKMQSKMKLDEITGAGQKPLPVSGDNMIIACLLHDLCKMGAYISTGNGKYKYKDQPKGHAELSITRLKGFIELAPVEEMMIRFHMGVYGLNEFYSEKDYGSGEYPLRGDHSQDAGLTKEESKEARYGKSLANAWYHNPIVKVMYFCDEISTLAAKAEEAHP